MSIQDDIRRVFILNKVDGKYIPWQQGALLNEINNYSKNYKTFDSITNEQLARVLCKMKSENKITRLKWATPSTKNIWILNVLDKS